MRVAERIALHHHERWDGRGYPQGLCRNSIPLPARIVTVADAFDALTHGRPYREAWPSERAAGWVRAGYSTHFDPAVVEALEVLVGQGIAPAAAS